MSVRTVARVTLVRSLRDEICVAKGRKRVFRAAFWRRMWSIRRRFGAFHLTANPVSARQKCYYWPIEESVEVSVGAVFYAKTGITELEICRFYNDILHIFSLL